MKLFFHPLLQFNTSRVFHLRIANTLFLLHDMLDLNSIKYYSIHSCKEKAYKKERPLGSSSDLLTAGHFLPLDRKRDLFIPSAV